MKSIGEMKVDKNVEVEVALLCAATGELASGTNWAQVADALADEVHHQRELLGASKDGGPVGDPQAQVNHAIEALVSVEAALADDGHTQVTRLEIAKSHLRSALGLSGGVAQEPRG